MATLAVLAIMAGCAVYQYLKGSIVKAFATIIIVLVAGFIAFGFYEPLAGFFISRGSNSRYPMIVPWAQCLCFALLFIVSFGVLQTILMQVTHQLVDFGVWPERVGRVICGLFLGLLVSGFLLVGLAMAPLPNQYPYARFDPSLTDADKPKAVFLKPDALVSAWFGVVSRGSFCALYKPRSFSVMRAGFLDQLYLNRLKAREGISVVTDPAAIEVPRKAGVWYAPENLKDTEGNSVAVKTGYSLMVVRVGFKRGALRDAGKFSLSQVRVICKRRTAAEKPLQGKGQCVFPIGYLAGTSQLAKSKLGDVITLGRDDFGQDKPVRYIDFVFYVPSDSVPVLLEFKSNAALELSKPVSTDEAPPVSPYQPKSSKPKTSRKPSRQPAAGASSGTRTPETTPKRRGLSNVSKHFVGDQFDEE